MANLERYLNRKTAGLILATSLTVGACSADVKPTLVPTSMPSSSPELVVATPTPSEAAGTANPSPEPSAVASATPEASQVPTTELAVINGAKWVLKNGDGKEMQVSLPDGFTPDARLVMATNIKKGTLNKNLSVYKDWEKALNTGRPVGDRLAGYNYDYNDFCPTADFKCNVQGDMYGWRLFQGMEVNIPGIGDLKGGAGRSVMVLFLNSTPDVTAWDNEGLGQVEVKRGFTATGREFDANPYSPKFQEMEPGLLGHWLYRQANGTPEKSYVGITNSPDNAQSTLFAVVVKNQWGNNPDGTPRYQFQLLDAGIAQFNGTQVNIK